MEWSEFLESVAIKYKLTAEQRDTLIARLDRKNDKKSNVRIAADLNISQSEIKKRLGDIYKIFEPTCPDLARSSRGKVEALRACLWQQYERQKSQPPQPKPVGIPNNLNRCWSGTPDFVGRESDWEWLCTEIQQPTQNEQPIIVSLAGMGGVGKTELAIQYARQNLECYLGGICWIFAGEFEVGPQIVSFAMTQFNLQIPEGYDLSQQLDFCWRHWWEGDVLLILDDVADFAKIQPYLPPDPRFKILMTTRPTMGSPVRSRSLKVLSLPASLELLGSEAFVGESRLKLEQPIAERLCEWLGYLPLGLELVGRYLGRKPDLSLVEMLARLEGEGLAAEALLKKEKGIDPDGGMTAKHGVAAAFELSWKELPENARVLSGLLSLLGVAPIPWGLIERCLPDWDEEELEDCRDNELVGRSLLARIQEYTYQLHPLIRKFFIVKLLENDPHSAIASIARNAPALLVDLLIKKHFNFKFVRLKAGNHVEPIELAKQFKLALESWSTGFSKLSARLLPVNDEGKVEAIGIKLLPADFPEISQILIGLKNRDTLDEEIIEFPEDLNDIKDSRLQNRRWRFLTSFDLNPEIEWCWNWGLKEIKSALARLINERQLKITEGSLLHERAWQAAYLLTGRHSANYFRPDPIPVQDIISSVSHAKSTSSYYQLISSTDLEHLEIMLKNLIEKDIKYLNYPWRQKNSQDEEVLLSYVNNVYSSALQAYDNLVNQYFKPLITKDTPKLRLASLLPCQVRGYLILEKEMVSWLWFPLSTAQEALDKGKSDITIGNLEIDSDDKIFSEAMEQTIKRYQSQKQKFSFTVHTQDTTAFSRRFPVSALVYRWLWKDLQDLCLVEKGRFEDRWF